MNVVHHYKVFIFLILEIFCKIFLFPCVVSGFFLLTAQGKLLTAHAIGTPVGTATTLETAKLFFNAWWRHHGLPRVIVLD